MRLYKVLSAAALVLMWSGSALAQDPVKVSAANYKVIVDNPTVRVLRVSVKPGAKTAMHAHPENIIIPLTAAKVRFTGADGKTAERDLAVESATFAPAETHMGENIDKVAVDAIVVEFKTKAAGTVTLPSTRDNMSMKLLGESPRGTVNRVTADPKFQEPAGSKHDYDQIVIALEGSGMSLALDGKPAKTKWARGDVVFIPRGTPHESKNTSGKANEFIIIAIR